LFSKMKMSKWKENTALFCIPISKNWRSWQRLHITIKKLYNRHIMQFLLIYI
jgi:hypothetical protein